MEFKYKKRLDLPERICKNPFCEKLFKPPQHRSQYCSTECNNYGMRRVIKKEIFMLIDPKCRCKACGYSNIDALVLSHVNNDGHIDRQLNKVGSGFTLYYNIKLGKRNIEGLEVLCSNCNTIIQARYKFVDPRDTVTALRLENNITEE